MPSRTLTLGGNLSESRLIINKNTRGINETFKKLSETKIEQINNDTKIELDFNQKLKNTLNKSDTDSEVNFLLFSYENNKIQVGKYYNSLPIREEVEFIWDIIPHPTIG